ncbi:MAG: hypothetical protein II350_06140, partial [Clostridia bacterium]|nr:hypothetical protein [Clostridia bacterium]
ALKQIEGMEVETLPEKRAMAELVEQIKAEMEAMEAVITDAEAARRAQESFDEKYGAPVRMGDCTSAEMAESIALKMFTEYMKMENLYGSSLPGDYYSGKYWQVELEGISTAKDVYNHIRSLSTKEQADVTYNNLFDGEVTLLMEENGKLYTTAFDSIPVQYEVYTDVT